ncbi:MAG TPA: ion transporter [Alphaproteobacteria bacterium]|nr:ion transporter [Alphaproteobacteria bacterium]USO05426.1 MAG: ion transporter [Rhodospirillales bacterium]HOO81374.1 ion transporter [Alphaproteobacteria bacterium]
MVRPTNLKDIQFTALRGRVARFIENKTFTNFIIAIIIVNAAILGLETDSSVMTRYSDVLVYLDEIALTIFVVELALKLFVYRLSFFRQGWNVFDFVIVGIALIPASGPLAILRALRILRVLRLVSVVPSMRRVIAALFHAIPGMASIMAVLLIIFYVASVLSTKLFGQTEEFAMFFGTIGASMYTLFQIMTLEGWSEEIVRPVMEVYPYAWVFFIPFIITTSFAVLNLFIGIIVDAMNIIHEKEEYKGPERRKNNIVSGNEIIALHREMAELKELIRKKS